MTWDVLSGVTKAAWDVMSGVTKTGMFFPGWQIFVGCFVRGGKKWHGMFCPAPEIFFIGTCSVANMSTRIVTRYGKVCPT